MCEGTRTCAWREPPRFTVDSAVNGEYFDKIRTFIA